MYTTAAKSTSKTKEGGSQRFSGVKWCVFLLMLVLMLVRSQRGMDFVREGFSVCTKGVLPVLFPFALLSALMCQTEPPAFLARPLCRFFGISEMGVGALFSGLISGFPVGASSVGDLYKRGAIGKNEAERLLCFINNPSCAFTVGVVGNVALGSLRKGVLLFVILTAVSLVTGRILKMLDKDSKNEAYAKYQGEYRKTTFPETVGKTALSMLSISGFIVAFSVITGYLRELLRGLGPVALAVLCGVTEISNGVYALADISLADDIKFALCGALCSFSGISVHMQVRSVLSGTDLSMRKYFASKITGALVCAVICCLVSRVSVF